MDPRLQNFIRQIIHSAINSAIHSIFWKMSILWTLVVLAILIGAVVYFQMY